MLRHWFRLPTFADDEHTHTARALLLVTWAVLAIALLYTILCWFLGGSMRSLLLGLAVAGVALLVQAFAWRGHVRLAVWLLTLALWGVLTWAVTTDGRPLVYDIVFTGYVLPILIAGFFIGWRASLLIAVLSLLVGLEMSATILGLTRDSVLNWLAHSSYFVFAVLLLGVATLNLRRARERSRRESQQRAQLQDVYDALTENSLQGLSIFQDGRIVFANRASSTQTGYSPQELCQMQRPLEVIHADDRQYLMDELNKTLLGERPPTHYEMRIVHRDGQIRWLEVFTSRILYQGRPALQAVSIDISAQKRATEALRHSQAWFAKIFNTAPVNISINRVDNNQYVDINASWCSFYGYSRDEVIGRTGLDLNLWFDLNERQRVIQQTINEGQLRNVEVRIRHRSGAPLQVLMSSEILELDGQPHYLTMTTDLAASKQAEHQRLELALARERLEFFKEFMGNISHDLKTPLSVINTSLYLLEREPQKQQEKLRVIKAQTVLLGRYIQDILTLSRLDHAPSLTFRALDLNESMSHAVELLRATAENKQIALQVGLAECALYVLADRDELHRLWSNLIENALNYTPNGGAVTVRLRQQGEDALAEISDTGIGISAGDLPHIFERFYRADKARSSQISGTGLGLAIAKKVIEMHGGSIDVESAPGVGSTFRVALPRIEHDTL
ncbi:MAG: PAS domain S-box protein [Chloroflexi bacterium]|nr:PAS domain S-box protein [Chloroflexota bacterium]